MANTQFVTIGDREYGRCIYSDGTRHYAVLTERRNQYGLRIQRTLNTPAIIAKIDAALIEADHAEALRDNAVIDQVRFYGLPPFSKAVAIVEAHAEALEMNADDYTYVKPFATSLVFKTDGRKVWWWSFNLGVWFPDLNVSPSTVHNHVTSGNGHYCSNPAP